jgi:hypothetical protein
VLRYLGIEQCVRLPIRVDASRLENEIGELSGDAWGAADRDPVVQASVESFFAVGYPRGPKPLPADDRPVLARLPYLRHLLHDAFHAQPTRAIVARLRPHGLIPIHTDTPRYFRGTVRLSIQIAAEGGERLFCNGLWYDLTPGEVWAIDNLTPHGIHNAGARARTNVVADFLPTDELVGMLAEGERDLGVADEAARAAIEAMSRERYRKYRLRGIRYELAKLVRRRDWWRGR